MPRMHVYIGRLAVLSVQRGDGIATPMVRFVGSYKVTATYPNAMGGAFVVDKAKQLVGD